MNLHDEVRRGQDALEILKNPVFKESWAAYEAVLLDLLANANTERGKAEEIRGWLIAARKARGHLERIVNDGKLAAKQIEQEESKKTLQQRLARSFRVA